MQTIFYTQAYNAEKTMARAIDSMLAQTCRDFVCIIADNGSTDNTRAIITEYASRDSRIRPVLFNKNAHIYNLDRPFLVVLEQVFRDFGDGYFVCLDADDEYAPTFLEKLINFMTDHELDVAACGYTLTDDETGDVLATKTLTNPLILTCTEDFDSHFPAYFHLLMGKFWGKVYKLDILRRCGFEDLKNLPTSYPNTDNLSGAEILLHAKRAGIYPEALYTYYSSKTHTTYYWTDDNISALTFIHQRKVDYLTEKTGHVSPSNMERLYRILFANIKRTIISLLNSNLSIDAKLAGIAEINNLPIMQELCKYSFMSDEEYIKTDETYTIVG